MYSYFEGELKEKTPTYAVIDCNGVGYFLNISLNTFSEIKDKSRCKLYAHLVVREDAMLLFGFSTEQELEMFRKLISVSGVGPNTARMVLSSLNPDELSKAIISSNAAILQSIKGIGGKTAQRILVDLRDKIGKTDISKDFTPGFSSNNRQEAITALVMLGFAKNNAEKAIDKVSKNNGENKTVEDLIKLALQAL